MKAEVISIGSELTSGQCLDTNSQWLSQRLAAMGVAVRWHTTLADDLEENVQAFRLAAERAELVIITGGLGPTQDDLTRDVLAQLAGVALVFHEPLFEQIRQMFASRSRSMPERNRVQAMFPAGSEPIPNDRGTAPGIWMRVERTGEGERGRAGEGMTAGSPHLPVAPSPTLFIAMPGVPGEMHAMFEKQVKPRLQRLTGSAGVVVQRKINCFGAGESAVEEKVLDLTRRGHVPEVGITVSDATISFRILAEADSVEAAQQQIEPVEHTLRDRLGDLVFGVEDEELQHAVARLLREKRLTLSVAEGVTGGLVSQRLAQVPGISQHFRGGVIAYDNVAKADWLAVPSRMIEDHGVVSGPVAEAMAAACRIRFHTDFALSTVGLAGPQGGTADKPIGLVHVGLAGKDGVKSQSYPWFGSRQEIQSRATKMALNILRLHLIHSC